MHTLIQRRRLLAGTALSALAGMSHAQAAPQKHSLLGKTLDGRAYDLQQDRGKAVLVFFWSTRCAVCRDKMPELRANYEAWRDKGFQLVAVSVDRSLDELKSYDGVVNRMVSPAQKFPLLWRGDVGHRDSFGPVSHTPTSFILDRQGLEVKQVRGRIDPALWDDMAELVLT
ncbi:MAG: TlpA family protein disulfide reductase [Rhizobacter sp.]|nr:TlpA family protein disulfide reductase [Rhizobacter sp.]